MYNKNLRCHHPAVKRNCWQLALSELIGSSFGLHSVLIRTKACLVEARTRHGRSVGGEMTKKWSPLEWPLNLCSWAIPAGFMWLWTYVHVLGCPLGLFVLWLSSDSANTHFVQFFWKKSNFTKFFAIFAGSFPILLNGDGRDITRALSLRLINDREKNDNYCAWHSRTYTNHW